MNIVTLSEREVAMARFHAITRVLRLVTLNRRDPLNPQVIRLTELFDAEYAVITGRKPTDPAA